MNSEFDMKRFLSLLVNVRDYLSKLRFEGMDMQLTNECWIELIEKELRNVRG